MIGAIALRIRDHSIALTLYQTLRSCNSEAWRHAIDAIAPKVHPIDRDATRIWFAFFPLDLHLDLESAEDPAARARAFGLMGKWRLADQIDASHRFLYAHRYWPQVEGVRCRRWIRFPPAVSWRSSPLWRTPPAEPRASTASCCSGSAPLALMTLRQVGPDAFAAAPGKIHLTDRVRALTPHQVMHRRAKDDWQGLFGFTRGLKKRWTVTFDENRPDACFTAINGQEIASAAQTDERDYRSTRFALHAGRGPDPGRMPRGLVRNVLGGRARRRREALARFAPRRRTAG